MASSEETTLADRADFTEGLIRRSFEQVSHDLDPRIRPDDRPTPHELDEGLALQLVTSITGRGKAHKPDEEKGTGSDSESVSMKDIIYVDWDKGDRRNPANFSQAWKWTITLFACGFTGVVASVAATYAEGYSTMIRDLNCTQFQATIGLSVYPLGFGVIPLATAALSEEFGRQPLYLGSALIFMLMHLGIALAKNIQTVLILRFIQGAAGSTGSTMVGGTIADIWAPSERGFPMAIFALAAVGGTGLGAVPAGWIDMTLGWRWIQWIHLIVAGVFFLLTPVLLRETRSGVLLTRLAKKIRKKTGDLRYRSRAEDERGSLHTLIRISCTRPLHLLVTEPVVASFSLWIGFAWGILYSLIESISPTFRELHGFSIGSVGTVFVTMTIGSFLGILTNFYQERLYQKNFPTRLQEGRLYMACVAGILFPVGMFIYAWTSFANVHWIGNAIGIVIFIWALFIMYLAVFTYLADCYGTYASSALAGQSLCRNAAGTVFPLFTTQMFERLTFKWSGTLFGCIAVLMAPIPFILFYWGPKIRARSKFASQVPAFGS